MTRDFIFDGSGAVIGYRCRLDCAPASFGKVGLQAICNRLFRSARGLWQHQRRAHGHLEQFWLYGKLSEDSKVKPRKKRKKAMEPSPASGLISSAP